ncbi:hypothetical protein OOT46_09265 [Aquabacterium sp. A7-Y]|uniref:hypothetical protein n=1 Tax=Aquabacterium sp. A7-Y TaxID=1349605 RepID=UPI00223E7911|nr:hypothetical protein [Aquabacterium sp. A7-Y]MCW7538035.1 hypothetical protein [Aquabacterium sp. A7-Y]
MFKVFGLTLLSCSLLLLIVMLPVHCTLLVANEFSWQQDLVFIGLFMTCPVVFAGYVAYLETHPVFTAFNFDRTLQELLVTEQGAFGRARCIRIPFTAITSVRAEILSTPPRWGHFNVVCPGNKGPAKSMWLGGSIPIEDLEAHCKWFADVLGLPVEPTYDWGD